jgi:hypothetical protein
MSPQFDAQSFEPFALQTKPNHQHMNPNSSLASNGFNIWWQKTAANNMAMVAEASDLMRAHRLGNCTRQPRAGQAH